MAETQQSRLVYHRISFQDISVNGSSDTVCLVARTLTDARVFGSRNVWRLQLAMDYVRRDGLWITECAVATLWN